MVIHPLQAFRRRENLTQAGLASLIGVSRAAICRWESGKRRVDRDLLLVIREKTGIAPRDLRPDLAELMEAAA